MGLISYLSGTDNRRNLKKLRAIADTVEGLEDKFMALDDEQLRRKTDEFKDRYNNNYETLDMLLPEAFATVREAARRVMNMRHFKVQLMGGACLHQGRIAEMRTGEGKTLVATLPTYLNALTGKGVHVVTVNDYLARYQAEWMGKIYRFLGMEVGVAVSGMTPVQKREAYAKDITYATNNELGFDYLRDNMVITQSEMVQRDLNFAIVDEVDSILIDEARTPLIISGKGGRSNELYTKANRFARKCHEDDYEIDEKKRTINLTDDGINHAEDYFEVENLTDLDNTELYHYIMNALKANYIMKKDVDYTVVDGEVIIVDEFTGRLMIGRRFNEGLHQAIEAKENVRIQSESQTLATITFQNYFRIYKKLAGMTGTAKTEETEFKNIYNLDVVVIPTNKPNARIDEPDKLFSTHAGKMKNIVDDIKECYERGQPVLVGTTSVEKSEEIDKLLSAAKVPHQVLNAKNHANEAKIVAQAGKLHQVTVATNMAGRGTDIMLGGNVDFIAREKLLKEKDSNNKLLYTEEVVSMAASVFPTTDPVTLEARQKYNEYCKELADEVAREKEEVIKLGGLRIIGTERHESRRIDNQLRGRSGRQGDIGSSVFYLSSDDEVLRLWGSKFKKIMEMFRMDEDMPMQYKVLAKQVENAQRSIEGHNYSIRKSVLEYDDVMNKQREIIYSERGKVLKGLSMRDQILKMLRAEADTIVDEYTNAKLDWQDWDYEELNKEIERKLLPEEPEFFSEERMNTYALEEIKDQLYEQMLANYTQKIELYDTLAAATESPLTFEDYERYIVLRVVDSKWMEHIDAMDVLRRGIGLKAYGQQNPVDAYKKEGFAMFDNMLASIQTEIVSILMHVRIENKQPIPQKKREEVEMVENRGDGSEKPKRVPDRKEKHGRNDPCPCGSGKKYKNCCGKE